MTKLHTLIISLLVIILSLASCTKDTGERMFCINGAWELQQVIFYDEDTMIYSNDMTWMRIYDDSCYYSCRIQKAPNGTMIAPSGFNSYTFVPKGIDEYLYLQGSDVHPLAIVGDSMMVIQEDGVKYMWRKNRDFEESRQRDIIGIIRMDRINDNDDDNNNNANLRYVYSKAEQQLTTTNHALIYILIIIGIALLVIVNYAHRLYTNKKRVEQELRRIEEERKAMPEPVRQALSTVESDFHQSDFYISMRRRIANGEVLKSADWDAIESQINSVYPRFTSTLLSLYNMSQVELRVCLLLKLNASPSEIASVLCKDTSTISSTRSRLYSKVFGKKGSSKDWDEFILSL